MLQNQLIQTCIVCPYLIGLLNPTRSRIKFSLDVCSFSTLSLARITMKKLNNEKKKKN